MRTLAGFNKTSHNFALLIGVGKSAYPQWSLPVTVKDVQAVKSVLTDPNLCGYLDNDQHVRSLCNDCATGESILAALDWLKAVVDSKSTVLVYYSGHGWLEESTDKYYLIPHDIEPFDIANSALAAEIFNNKLREIQAKKLLVLIDSCHAQGMATVKEQSVKLKLPSGFVQAALPKSLIDDLKQQGEGRAVFTSSRGEQQSWIFTDEREMSIYTYHFLEGLQGAGNKPGDTVVQVSNLMNHLSKTVPESAQREYQAEQRPYFELIGEDFPVALLQGGKGLPESGWNAVADEATEIIQRLGAGQDIINNSGDQKVEQSGSNNINIGSIGKVRDINLSSKSQ